MAKRLALVLFLCLPALAQTVPGPVDCYFQFSFTAAGTSPAFDNRTLGCAWWQVYYQAPATATGFTLTFESATGLTGPGAFSGYAGNTFDSSTSFGTAVNGLAVYCGLATCVSGGVTVNTPWVAVALSGTPSSGPVQGTVLGWKSYPYGGGSGGGGGGGGGCVGTVMTPCVVEGVGADGAALAGNPVRICGTDGTDCRTIATDANGYPKIIGAVPVGSAAPNPVTTGLRDDSGNVQADYRFPDQAAISISSATAVRIVAGAMSKNSYIGHVFFSIASGTTVQFVQGTTVSTPCDTSQANLSGQLANTAAVALDFDVASAWHTTTTGNDICVLFGASSTGGGAIVYGQH